MIAEVLTTWHLDPVVAVLLAAAGAAYLAGASRARRGLPAQRRRTAWPARRTAFFLTGLAALALALLSGLDVLAEERLSVHMVQHLVLMMIAAPLLVAGSPVTLALRAAPSTLRAGLRSAVRSRAARVLTHPVTGFAAFAAVVLGTHFSPFYDAAVTDPALHTLEHAAYAGASILFWLPLLGVNPIAHRLGWLGRAVYLFAAMPVVTAVGATLTTGLTVRYDAYQEAAAAARISALGDQQEAGALMWAGGTMMLAIALLTVVWAALLREERQAAAVEEARR